MAEAEQTGNTSGQTPLPLWVMIGVAGLADASPDSDEGAFIGEYPSDEALQSAVDGHPLQDYILAAIQEVRRGAASTDEDEAKAGDTSGQTALPLWVTIGVKGLADASIDSEEDAFIGEYPSDEALQSAVDGHPLQDYILAAIQEVRRGAASTDEDEAKAGDTSGQTALPLWVTIGVKGLADASIDSEEDAFIGEYPSDEALQSAVDGHPLQDYILAAIQEVRGGEAASTETTSPQDDGAKDAS